MVRSSTIMLWKAPNLIMAQANMRITNRHHSSNRYYPPCKVDINTTISFSSSTASRLPQSSQSQSFISTRTPGLLLNKKNQSIIPSRNQEAKTLTLNNYPNHNPILLVYLYIKDRQPTQNPLSRTSPAFPWSNWTRSKTVGPSWITSNAIKRIVQPNLSLKNGHLKTQYV